MSDDKYLSLTLVNPDTHYYFNDESCVEAIIVGTSTWILLDEYPCKSPLRWSGKSLQSVYPKIVETKKQLEAKYQLLRLLGKICDQDELFKFNQDDLASECHLQDEIDADPEITDDIQEIYDFIYGCVTNWKDVENALITIKPVRWSEHWEDYYLTEDVKQSLKIDHLELIEDNDMTGLTKLLLPWYEAEHVDKPYLLINTPFINHICDGIQVYYNYQDHYVTDDGWTFNEFDMLSNSGENQQKVDQYFSELAHEYGCEYVGHELRRKTDHRMNVKSSNGDFTELNNGLSELLQCIICAFHDLKNAYRRKRKDGI